MKSSLARTTKRGRKTQLPFLKMFIVLGMLSVVFTSCQREIIENDSRNGFFIAATAGISNVSASAQRNTTEPIQSWKLFDAAKTQEVVVSNINQMNKILDKIWQTVDYDQQNGKNIPSSPIDQVFLKALFNEFNALVASAQQELNGFSVFPDMLMELRAKLQNLSLQAEKIQDLSKAGDVPPTPLTSSNLQDTGSISNSQKQQIISIVQNMKNTLAETITQETNILQGIEEYNNYQDKLRTQTEHLNTYQSIVDKIKSQLGSPVSSASGASSFKTQLQDLLKDFGEIASNSNMQHILSESSYESSVQQGTEKAKECDPTNPHKPLETCFQTSFGLPNIHATNTESFNKFGEIDNAKMVQILAWFQKEVSIIEDLHAMGLLNETAMLACMAQLQQVYSGNMAFIDQKQAGSGFSPILGNPSTYFPLPHKYTIAAPNTQTPHFASMPSSPIRVSTTNFINSVSHAVNSTFFANKAYNVGGGAGYQRFFSKYFGFDVLALGGYSFIVPTPSFVALKDLNVGYMQLTADMLADFYVDSNPSNTNFAGVYLGFTEKINFMNTKIPADSTHGVLCTSFIDLGTRYQHNAWVYKLGVRVPLYKSAPFRMSYQDFTYFINNEPSNIEVYFMLERLFGKRTSRTRREVIHQLVLPPREDDLR
ncbi:hypothetical protein ACFOPX_02245 [Helicobacter baculiformis]|uniref:Outer membrane protein n=3 Tax=Helicobacter baculiformis TaxID=427351 RepID=A0ABV7ZFP0_9HELI